ncbi:MAG TPA: inositol monophosphatase family protein [Candidatus Hydrogenedentes bacterium]|jgi:3'(2'), 5'-bisphosphate nucleotidase|nr:MAG: Histidinol-phosphatase [Candidatus Hydrogenedentes bacterium ADurb.Bin170]HOD94416.1 inositol monophosphatase family protein [Candidatus Hydrogenedentota bacterium]HOM47625.1 inositol monophosphatase family protein [Candidatus Hydrogenedentota bacterium]HOR51882.1 inositol monophosphatase family protein [Candidatus Hydrogenedentota bacterium]HPK25557.1 inositol monophosphatase family protein [Candidatus Hydrogenedentota bacterium]
MAFFKNIPFGADSCGMVHYCGMRRGAYERVKAVMAEFFDQETGLILSVLREAAMLAVAVREESALFTVEKSDLSPVTVADFAIQALVSRRLGDVFPDAVLVAEEDASSLRAPDGCDMLEVITSFVSRFIPGATGGAVCDWIDQGAASEGGALFWTLDPIDGTKGYRRGGQYAVALAQIEDGHVIRGGLACPALGAGELPAFAGTGLVAAAKRGAGAWLFPLSSAADPSSAAALHVNGCSDPSKARMLRSFEAGHTDVSALEQLADALNLRPEANVLMDSQAKFAVLASGGAEFIFRLLSPERPGYKEYIWDQAAGSLVVEEAGGRVTDLKGDRLDFSQGRRLLKNTGVVASNGVLHDAALAALQMLPSL